MGVKLVSVSGGSVEINPPATASNFTATMPAGTGNVVVNGVNGALVSGTAVASTSGTSIDFTGIPSWVKRITVMFQVVSTNGTSAPLIQIGSGSVTTSGYTSSGAFAGATNSAGGVAYTTGFGIPSGSASSVLSGHAVLTALTSTVWICSFNFGVNVSGTVYVMSGGGISSALSGALDRVRITTVNGTDTFDAGSINILYE